MLTADHCEQRRGGIEAVMQTASRPAANRRFLVQIRRDVVGALYWVRLDESWHQHEGTYYTEQAAGTVAMLHSMEGARVVPVVCLPEAT